MANHLYICDTLYHIYISILKSYSISGRHVIYIKDTLPNYDVIETELRKSSKFYDVRVINERFLIEKSNPLVLLRLNKYFDVLEREIINDEYEIIFFLDTTYYAKYLLKYYRHLKFSLVEDGELAYARKQTSLRDVLKFVLRLPLGFGRDRAIKLIEVQNPDRLPQWKRAKSKTLSICTMENSLSTSVLQEIWKIFSFSPAGFNFNGSSILLTQPLSEDNLISESEKIVLYRGMINKYLADKTVIIKKHPREKTDYVSHFPGVMVISGNFPVELLNHNRISFDVGLTLFSSSLNNLRSVERPIFLGLEYSQKVRLAYSKKHGLKLL